MPFSLHLTPEHGLWQAGLFVQPFKTKEITAISNGRTSSNALSKEIRLD